MSRTKGARDKSVRKPSANSSADRMRALAAARKLPEKSETVRVFASVKAAMFAKVKRQDRTRFASSAITTALEQL